MLSAGIKARNTKFNSLSKEDKKVAIARDVLKQLKLKTFRAKKGSYLTFDRYYATLLSNESFQEKIIDKEIICNVCAKGALFCSMVVFKNKVTVRNAYHYADSDSYIKSKLKGIFTAKELNKIEARFEGQDGYYSHYIATGKRMKEIMNNIIKNKGEFKP